VQAHGGSIELSSRVGQGTTARILLPCDPPAAVDDERVAAGCNTSTHDRKTAATPPA
jgi:hypothetical protein